MPLGQNEGFIKALGVGSRQTERLPRLTDANLNDCAQKAGFNWGPLRRPIHAGLVAPGEQFGPIFVKPALCSARIHIEAGKAAPKGW